MLLLAPDDLGVLVLRKLGAPRVEWERSKLFDSANSDVSRVLLSPLSHKVVVDLTGAENDLSALLRLDCVILFRDNSLELSARCEFTHVTGDLSHLKHFLGCDNNEGLTEGTEHLSAEDVEVLSGSGAVHNLDVAFFIQITLGQSQGTIVGV